MDDIQVQGTSVPALGLGTWQLTGQSCRETVETALDMGYRHIDTAQAYGNERQVGLGMDAAAVDREDVFLTTKLDGSNRDERSVRRSTRESLNKLGTDYIDLLLIHWPNTPWMTSLSETLGAMNDLVDEAWSATSASATSRRRCLTRRGTSHQIQSSLIRCSTTLTGTSGSCLITVASTTCS